MRGSMRSRVLAATAAAALAALGLAVGGPAAAQPNQPAPNVPFPANVDYPSGGYGDYNPGVLGESYVQGADVNVDWSAVQLEDCTNKPACFDWTGLDDEAEAASALGKHIVLVVRAASETGGVASVSGGPNPGTYSCTSDPAPGQIIPQWELSKLGSGGTFCDGDLETIIPDWFSPTFQQDFQAFVTALAQHVSQQPYYSLISYVRIGVGLGGESFPVMPDGVGNQGDEAGDLAWMATNWHYSAQAWESFQESMLTAYEAAFPAVTVDGTVIPPPPLIYPIDDLQTIPGHENPVDYEVADWATSNYDMGIGEEALGSAGLRDYADWDNILPMVFQNNPDVYVQFQTGGVTTSASEEEDIIAAAEGYGAKSIEWYEATWQSTGFTTLSADEMTSYQTWVSDSCKPGCPAPSTPGIGSYTPSSGSAGTTVTITGENLASATAVAFNGTTATIESDTATKIVAEVPAGATTGPITVTTADGTATTPASFTVTS